MINIQQARGTEEPNNLATNNDCVLLVSEI